MNESINFKTKIPKNDLEQESFQKTALLRTIPKYTYESINIIALNKHHISIGYQFL